MRLDRDPGRLIREHDIKPGEVDKVDVGANHAMTTSLLHHRPTTGLQAKFSMEFCLSLLVLERKAGRLSAWGSTR